MKGRVARLMDLRLQVPWKRCATSCDNGVFQRKGEYDTYSKKNHSPLECYILVITVAYNGSEVEANSFHPTVVHVAPYLETLLAIC